MGSPAHGALRLLRAGVLAAVVLGTAAVAHVAGGGALGSGPLLALVAAVVVWACAVVTRWRLSPLVVLVLLGLSQVGLHEVFMVVSQASAVPASGAADPMVAMGHAGTASSPLVMGLCHVAGTAVLAGVCARGERSLWALWSWLAPLVAVLVAVVRTTTEAPRGVFASVVVRRHLCELFAAVPRRGPPARVVA